MIGISGLFPQPLTWLQGYLQTHQRSFPSKPRNHWRQWADDTRWVGRSICEVLLAALYLKECHCVPVLSTQVSHIISGQNYWQKKLFQGSAVWGERRNLEEPTRVFALSLSHTPQGCCAVCKLHLSFSLTHNECAWLKLELQDCYIKSLSASSPLPPASFPQL